MGSSEALSIAEVAQIVGSALDRKNAVQIAASSKSGAGISRYVPATLRAETELGLRPTSTIVVGIRKTIAWQSLSLS